MENTLNGLEIAVIGMSCRYPEINSPEQLWDTVIQKKRTVKNFTNSELNLHNVPLSLRSNKKYVPVSGHVEGIEYFDNNFFNLSKAHAKLMDPQQRLLLELSAQALSQIGFESAGNNQDTSIGNNVGVFVGAGENYYLHSNLQPNLVKLSSEGLDLGELIRLNDSNFRASRIAHCLKLSGPAISIGTACSTSLVAIHMACRALIIGDCDYALAGAASLLLPNQVGYIYRDGDILSSDGYCFPFNDQHVGTVPSSGGGVVLLTSLKHALEQGHPILAVVKGSAVNNDGESKQSFVAPSIRGQIEVIENCIDIANIPKRSIGLIETHGTGTSIGDQVELEALKNIFSSENTQCALGFIKANIGHTDTGAGVAGFIKAVMSVYNGIYAPEIYSCHDNCDTILVENTPFYIHTSQQDWVTCEFPRRAGVTSLGVGGTNCHVILEQWNQHYVDSALTELFPETNINKKTEEFKATSFSDDQLIFNRNYLWVEALMGEEKSNGKNKNTTQIKKENSLTSIKEFIHTSLAEIVGIESVAEEDGFFEIGGDSITLISLNEKISECYDIDINLFEIYEKNSIKEIVEFVEKKIKDKLDTTLVDTHSTLSKIEYADDKIEHTKTEISMIPNALQNQFWAHSQLNPDSDALVIAMCLVFDKPLNKNNLEKSIFNLLEKNAILRSHFSIDENLKNDSNEKKSLKFKAFESMKIPIISIEKYSESRDISFDKIKNECLKPFNTSKNLTRFIFLNDDEMCLSLGVAFHHSVMDGDSLSIFLAELWKEYSLGPDRVDPINIEPIIFSDPEIYLSKNKKQLQYDYWVRYLDQYCFEMNEYNNDFVKENFIRKNYNTIDFSLKKQRGRNNN